MLKNLLDKFRKKSPNPYPKSFGKRLTRRIMLLMLIFMGIPTLLLFWTSFKATHWVSEEFAERLLKGKYEMVRRIASDVYVASVNTAPFIEDNLDNPDKMYDIMEGMLRTNTRIRSCGISFVADYYPQKGHWFCPYAVRRDSVTIETMTVGNADHDYLHEDWFVEAVARDSSYWSTPFFGGTDGQTALVSYLIPIHDRQQRVVAVLGVDMSLIWFSEKLEPLRSKDDEFLPYFFVVDSAGTFLSHPRQERIIHQKLQDNVTADPDSVSQQILKSREDKTSSQELSVDDVEVFVTTHPVKYAPWTIGLAFPTLLMDILSYLFVVFMSFFIIIGMLVVMVAGRSAIRKASLPIRLLALSANDVAKGNFESPLPQMKTRDEIHKLRDSFEKMEQSLLQYTEQLKTTTSEKATIESELNIAHSIQMSMLPKTFPPYPDRDDVDIFGQVTPAKAVGGDLFDFFISDEKLFFCIGDVSGKGVPASMFMAVARSLFHNVSGHIVEPDIIAKALNESMCDGNDMNMFVTMFIGVLDLQTGHLSYCNAGHDAPLLIGQGVGVLPCESNLPIGLMDWEFVPQETTIAPGTTIFLYTDGLNEAENALHQQFGDEQVLSLAKELLANGQNEPMQFVQRMTAAVHFFAGEAEQSDDLTMLAIQYKKEGTSN